MTRTSEKLVNKKTTHTIPVFFTVIEVPLHGFTHS
ncbi:uncharacterized protein METZ01_LOCUS353596 [marine metagenome]|uniref:Uncharacterized protein n=1 Tax=marine metagenome TaxID=408172 RepID=A0A382RTX6_9ZZZZ